MWRTCISSVGRPINPTIATHPPTLQKKSPTQPRPLLLTGENLRSAALHFEAGRGVNQRRTGRDQASSKADLISTSEVLEMSLMLVLEGVLEVEVEVASNV